MAFLLHIIAALLWVLFGVMATGFGATIEKEPDRVHGLMLIVILLVGSIAFTLQVMA
ncbi:MAG: hypothetical protein GYB53_21400 [Rhodobacteraceae bacterium]|nr:hypothetical protein [Paracoccaceae bacterium]MBR9823057.1 hypothetical protein [Paracoccaceae bacterium]